MLYIMLSGFPPFYGPDDIQIRYQIMKFEFDFKDKEWDSVSNEAINLIR